jgi:thioredoxin reductase
MKSRPGHEVVLDINPENRTVLMEQLTENWVEFLFDLDIREFTADGILVTDETGKQKIIRTDTIVLALGSKPENKLAYDLKEMIKELYVVGDCVNPRRIGEAIHEGYLAGWRI